MLRLLLHIVLFCLLTILTQIGGIAYLLALLLVKKTKKKYRLKRGLLFVGLYLLITFLIVPTVAPFFGRQKIENNETITAHFYGTILLNRNYVSSELHQTLQEIAQQFHQENPNLKVMYLDANFPFFDGFPLLPHLSHSDGKKVDLSFVYNDPNENPSNKNPSNTGYGVFEDPQVGETNQTKACKNRGYWQYDFPKYLTLGSTDKLSVNAPKTKRLVQLVVQHPTIRKVFLEPHLKKRWKLNSSKIRFQGCRAVRHDDHIHIQL